ncbi:hypothetical protein BBJ28_00019819 [Nothophytophthora sp. Chile5]|nr:hypothetical protein BBJ28_00019819 [Nothophytophthora sp. Chile5]
MEFGGAWRFPSLTPRVSELYGASGSFRVGEADAYALELDELEQEERALERMVQSLVDRRAPVPIGVKFHREGGGQLRQSLPADQERRAEEGETPQYVDSSLLQPHSSDEEEEEEEEGDDMDEEDMEEDDSDEAQEPEEDEDPFARDDESVDNDSMDMDMGLPPPEDWQ